MPQPHLPLFPAEVTCLNPQVSFAKRQGRVYYFNGPMPVFSDDEKDYASFQMFTSQLVENGNCTQAEIVRAFGISAISMKRYVKKYREGGPARFFQKQRTRSAVVLRAEVIEQAQQRLNAGEAAGEARSLLREIFTTEADLLPDEKEGTLTVSLHHLANASSDRLVQELSQQLNASETIFPGTSLRLIYKLVSC